MTVRLAVAVLLLSAALRSAAGEGLPAAAADGLYGQPVVSVTFDGDAEVDADALVRVADLAPGRALTRPALRAALRNLFATRIFSDLSAEAEPVPGGLHVVIRFAAAPRIAKLSLVGVALPQRGRLRDAVGLGVGDTWTERAGDDAVRGIERLLHEHGNFEAKVLPVVEAGPDETSVVVRFEVVPGRRARAGAPLFSAPSAPLPSPELRRAARLKEGAFYTEAKARDDASRYEALYHKDGRSRAEVRFDRPVYDPVSNVARPRYILFVGPKVVLEVTGATVAEVKKHADSPWAKGEPPDEESVRRLAESLRRSYQEKGHARARVDVAFRTNPDEEVVALTIVKGDRYVVSHVTYDGILAVPMRDVLELMSTTPRGLLTTGRLVDQDLAHDRDAILGLYRLRGYPDARIVKTSVTDGVAPFTLDVALSVDEGPRVLVEDRSVKGEERVPEGELLRLLAVTPGKPYNAADVDADVARIRTLYSDRGFIDARVDGAARLDTPPPPRSLAASIGYTVFEGEPVTFGATVIRGNRKTRLGVIEREIAHKRDEPFSLAKLIETQQNLTRLGIFQRVELSSFPTDPESRSRTVVVTVSEGKPWSILYGVGAEYQEAANTKSFSERLSLGLSYNNLFGRALSIGGEARRSRSETRILATIRDRALFDAKVPVSLTVFRATERRPTFEVSRRGTFVEAEKRTSKLTKMTLRYQYEIVQPTATEEVKSGLERQNRELAISSIAPGITYDSRDDPIDPRHGFFASADAKYAFSFLSANARFLKGTGQAAMYRSFKKTVFAVNLRVGAIESFGTCAAADQPACPSNLEIPIVERFYAGGRTSHRAFSLDDLGIFGQTLTVTADGKIVPVGGNGLLVANVEWRIPVYGDFGVSLFYDAGNVWADYRHIKLGDLRSGIGLGLHYLTPVGPLRLEYGRKVDVKSVVRPDGTVFRESPGAFSFSVGYPF